MKQKVLVLMGGFSREREISLQSGESCYQALLRSGLYDVEKMDFSTDIGSLMKEIESKRDAVIFNATHGLFGEDGSLQHLLDNAGLRYTHSSASASHLAFHKHLAGSVLRSSGLPMARHEVVPVQEVLAVVRSRTSPIVVKPTSEGSSIGVYVLDTVERKRDFCEMWGDHLEGGSLWLIEDFVPGRELTVGVLGGEALQITDICYHSATYDYQAKYDVEHLADHICPAVLPREIEEEVLRVSALSYDVLGCSGLARVDLRFDEKKGKQGIVILEVNTQPGMTEVSLAPEQAHVRGITMEDLVVRLVEDALR